MNENKRDLHADLAICDESAPGPWVIATTTDDTFVLDESDLIVSASERHEDARFIAEARTGWPHAIGRALEAEREADALRERLMAAEAERDELRKIVSEECPIAAFDLVTSLRAEKAHTMERVAELEAEVERLRKGLEAIRNTAQHGAHFNPDAFVQYVIDRVNMTLEEEATADDQR